MKSILIKNNNNEEATSRVKNLLVENLEISEEVLIKTLIHYQIQYVKVGNEFHFLDKIYRLYDFDQIRKTFSDCVFDSKSEDTKEIINQFCDLRTKMNYDSLLISPENFEVSVVDGDVESVGKTKAPVYTKSMMKVDNKRNGTRLNMRYR